MKDIVRNFDIDRNELEQKLKKAQDTLEILKLELNKEVEGVSSCNARLNHKLNELEEITLPITLDKTDFFECENWHEKFTDD